MIKIIDINFLNKKSAVGCFLLKENDNFVLVETGPSLYYEEIKKSLNDINVDIKKIKNVLVTHIHLDHSGGAWKFAKNGASIYVHPKGAPHLISPEKLISSASMIYGNDMDRLWGKVEKINSEKVISVSNNEIIKIGNFEFKALYTPGHANHHIAWQFEKNIFTGDVAGAKIGNGPVMPACPPPDIDLKKWEESLILLEKEKPKKLYLTHFGEHKNIDNHFSELRDSLLDWSLWIKEKRKKYLDDNTLVKKFNEYVYEKMQSQNISSKLIDQYYAANPPYMSVSGLKRYWDKYGK